MCDTSWPVSMARTTLPVAASTATTARLRSQVTYTVLPSRLTRMPCGPRYGPRGTLRRSLRAATSTTERLSPGPS